MGRFQRDGPWESCITIGRQWAWKAEDELPIDTVVRVELDGPADTLAPR